MKHTTNFTTEAPEKHQNLIKIATAINHQVASSGVKVKLKWQDDYLGVLLESAITPDKNTIVTQVEQAVRDLDLDSIRRIRIYGRRIGQRLPSWQEDILLSSETDRDPQAISLLTWLSQGNSRADLTESNASGAPKSPTLSTLVSPTQVEELPEFSRKKFLRFRLGNGTHSFIPLNKIREVLSVPGALILPIPHMPSLVVGIYNCRGEMLWLIDLDQQLGIRPRLDPIPGSLNAVVIESGDRKIGFLIAGIVDIESYAPGQIQPASSDLFPTNLLTFLQGYLTLSSSPVFDADALVQDDRLQLYQS